MSETVHATAVLCGADGILIRGASGAGKSTLAALLVRRGAHLVADDRVHLSACHGRLVATAPGITAGRLELRGRGLLRLPNERAVIARLVVELVGAEGLERLPEDHHLKVEILGITLPRQPVPDASDQGLLLVEAALGRLRTGRDMDLRSSSVWG